MSAAALRLSARWVAPLAGPPIAEGAVLVDRAGRIAAVGPAEGVPTPPGAAREDLGEAILLPGLVNTHAHLELTHLRGLVRDRPFSSWVRAVRSLKQALRPAAFDAAARRGVLEQCAAGIVAIGDTGSTGAAARAMASLGVRGVAYQETFGPAPDQVSASLAELEAALAQLRPLASARLAIGVSPHAPYTVSSALLEAVCDLAAVRGLPLAMHLAESAEEHALIAEADGPFAEAQRRRGIPVEPRGRSPVDWALRHGLARTRPLCIHLVTADDADLSALAGTRATVAHCPWSNAVLGNGRADLGAMRRHGLVVGVGSDSVAAGGAVDLFAESRLAALGAALTPREQLRLITADGAAALGLTDTGVIAPGGWGDLTAVRLTASGARDPEGWLAHRASATDVIATWIEGRPVYRAGTWPDVDVAAERTAFEDACRAAAAVRWDDGTAVRR